MTTVQDQKAMSLLAQGIAPEQVSKDMNMELKAIKQKINWLNSPFGQMFLKAHYPKSPFLKVDGSKPPASTDVLPAAPVDPPVTEKTVPPASGPQDRGKDGTEPPVEPLRSGSQLGGLTREDVITQPDRARSRGDPLERTRHAFRMLDSGYSPLDIMGDYDLTLEETKSIISAYINLKSEENKIRSLKEVQMGDWYNNIVKYMGEDVRKECKYFSDESGCCTKWGADDLDDGFRRRSGGLFKTLGNKVRLHVIDHPECCAVCQRTKYLS